MKFFRAQYGVIALPDDWPIDEDGDYLAYIGTRTVQNDTAIDTLWLSPRLLTRPISEADARLRHPALFTHLEKIDRGEA